jgi:hypothetical protein
MMADCYNSEQAKKNTKEKQLLILIRNIMRAYVDEKEEKFLLSLPLSLSCRIDMMKISPPFLCLPTPFSNPYLSQILFIIMMKH